MPCLYEPYALILPIREVKGKRMQIITIGGNFSGTAAGGTSHAALDTLSTMNLMGLSAGIIDSSQILRPHQASDEFGGSRPN
jgi:hypothetical protein